MGFNRNNLNLGNQFSHAAEVAKGEARENSSTSRPYYKVPNGMEYHKWTANEERFNILLAKNNANDPDSTGYKFYKAVPVHELPNLADPKHPHKYPCLHIIGKPCPCCDRKDQLDDGSKGGENWERIKPFIPKERMLYYFNPEGTNKILVHECAARQKGDAAFPQRLMAQATAMGNGSIPVPFASPNTDGCIVKVNTAKDTFNGNEFYSASAVNFFQRRELPADSLYDRCLPWNELLNFGTYEEMERVMNGGEPDDFSSSNAQAQTQTNSSEHYTEEQKQAEFERACEQSLPQNNGFQQTGATHYGQPNNGFQQAPAQNFAPREPQNNGFQAQSNGFQQAPAGFTNTPANSAPARSFPSESAQPNNSGCPAGLRFGMDFESSRKCCNCNAYEACRNARRNG